MNETYNTNDITEYYSQQPQQVAAPAEPFSFGKANQQSNVSGREFFDVETFNSTSQCYLRNSF